jgi:hypothetical protein
MHINPVSVTRYVAEAGAAGVDVVVLATFPALGLLMTLAIGAVDFKLAVDTGTLVFKAVPAIAVDGTIEPAPPGPVGVLFRLNAAVTVVGAVRIMLQGFVEPHPPPLKLPNPDPVLGTAITVTAVPGLYCMQFVPHAVPTGVIATVPPPLPVVAVVTEN